MEKQLEQLNGIANRAKAFTTPENISNITQIVEAGLSVAAGFAEKYSREIQELVNVIKPSIDEFIDVYAKYVKDSITIFQKLENNEELRIAVKNLKPSLMFKATYATELLKIKILYNELANKLKEEKED